MGRVYAKVSLELWGDRRFRRLSPLQPSGQALWLYLLTGDFRTAIPGLSLRVGRGALSDRLGWTVEQVDQHWQEIRRAKMAEADWRAGVIWMPRAIDHNPPESANVVMSWRKVVLPECALVRRALASLRRHLTEGFAEGFVKAFDEGFREPSPNQEQEQEYVPPQPPSGEGGRAKTLCMTRNERRRAEHRREMARGCPHEPICADYERCIARFVRAMRDEHAAGLQEAG